MTVHPAAPLVTEEFDGGSESANAQTATGAILPNAFLPGFAVARLADDGPED